VDTQKLCVGSTCINQQQLASLLASANQSGTGASSSADSSATPPVLQVNGDNPAIIQVGATYTDLGATITGPTADLNLGITTYINGIEMNPVQLDTTQAATDTIAYVATDSAGLTSTSTRTVIVEPDSAESPTGVLIESPSIVPTDDASSTAAARVATSTP
jgi:Domain of unknown function (DUF5011)